MAQTLYALDKLIHSLSNRSNVNASRPPFLNEETEHKDIENDFNSVTSSPEDDNITIGAIKNIMRSFVRDRNWEQFHTPRNILLALVGEIG